MVGMAIKQEIIFKYYSETPKHWTYDLLGLHEYFFYHSSGCITNEWNLHTWITSGLWAIFYYESMKKNSDFMRQILHFGVHGLIVT